MSKGGKRGLGRGLGALIPDRPEAWRESEGATRPDRARDTGRGRDRDRRGSRDDRADREQAPDLAPVPGMTYAELPVAAIGPNPRQPRQAFDEESLAELVQSIQTVGLLQPVVVRPVGGGRFELVAGERRWRAFQVAGLASIPAIVRDTADDALLRDALLENLHRIQLNPLEEAAAYSQLLQDFGCSQDELAQHLGRSRPQVSNTLRLLKLPAPVQRRVAAGVLSAGHARALLALDDEAAMDALAARIVAEGLSVRAVEEIVLLGEADGRARDRTPRPRGRRPVDPEVAAVAGELAERIADRLDTRVTVDPPRSPAARGRVVVEFADLDDLRRIVAALED